MLIRPALREYRTWAMDSRRWADYQPRPGDIVIATPPKCGTTWTQQIVAALVFQDARPRPLPVVSPWLEARFSGHAEEGVANLQAQTHRRFVKTHLPADGLPLYEEVRYLHVARDGRDAAMSMHNHFTGYTPAQLADFDRVGLEDPAVGRPIRGFPTARPNTSAPGSRRRRSPARPRGRPTRPSSTSRWDSGPSGAGPTCSSSTTPT